MKTWYQFTCSNGDVWRVPVLEIAKSKARHYSDEMSDDAVLAFVEFFDGYKDEVEDWARNSMDWEDVCGVAEMVENFDETP